MAACRFLTQSLSFLSGKMDSMLLLCSSIRKHEADDTHVHMQESRLESM